MNRQYCILVYSKTSPSCQKLFEYIESLPFDLMNTTGITPCCADNKTMRDSLLTIGVEVVPTLMTKYFNRSQQQIQGDDIYSWISAIADRMGYAENSSSGSENTTLIPPPETPVEEKEEEEEEEEDLQPKPKGIGKKNLLTQALSMQKSRENETSSAKKIPQII